MRWLLAVVLCSTACGTAMPGADAGPPLVCEVPQSLVLVPSSYPENRGIPMAGIRVDGGRCSLSADERVPGVVLVVADFEGGALVSTVVAAPGTGFSIESSSLGGPTSYLADFPRDTDIDVTVVRDAYRVSLTFRLETGDRLVLVALSEG